MSKKPRWLNDEIEAVFHWRIVAMKHNFRITKLEAKKKNE